MLTSNEARTLRKQLVAELERRGVIRSERVREAFLAVPRELFVPAHAAREGVAAVYRDEAILTKRTEHGAPLSSSSQPAIMASMLEQLGVEEGMRVLEVGAGSGYNAALLATLVGKRGRVVSVDVDRAIAIEARRALREGGYRVRVVCADGRAFLPAAAPYDRIVVTASADTIPRPWFEQLVDDGWLVVPLRLKPPEAQVIPVLRKTPRGFRSLGVVRGGFMPLRSADEDGVAQMLREPCVIVSDMSTGGHEPLLQLNGAALATLSGPAKRRLVATAVGEPRKRRLGLRADHGALSLYLSLTLPTTRRVTRLLTYGIGAIGRDGRSLALIEARPERSEVGVMTSYGGSDAESFLFERVHEWARRGRPGTSDLQITVTFEGDVAELATRWPRRVRRPQHF